MQVTVNTVEGPTATVQGGVEYSVSVSVAAIAGVSVAIAGTQGPPGEGGLTPGPGFQIVGTELRYNLQSLTRG